jgi:hypothetical protein
MPMVLVALTEEDRARHERAIAKMRQRLFRRHAAEDYRIAPDSERVIAAHAEECWNAACGTYRLVRLGGLAYRVDCADPAGASRFAISHSEADQFNFWLSSVKGYTLSALTVRFRDLDEIPFRYVSSAYRANVAPLYVGRTQR